MRPLLLVFRPLLAIAGAVMGAIAGARAGWLSAELREPPPAPAGMEASMASPPARRPRVSMSRPALQVPHRNGDQTWILDIGPVTVIAPDGELEETVDIATEYIEAYLVDSAERTYGMFFMDQPSSHYH